MSNLFIPEKIRVGFQNRDDTYTGRLAYIIYYDAKGVLRKEISWKQWRDGKIEPEEFDNKPQDGFHLNKDIKRYNWSHYGSNRSYIRIYDSRGIEFEITPENLIGLLTETTCSKRGIDGKFVYAWCGPELVLLPCSSEEYSKAMEYTKLQSKKISARDLKPGCSYTNKKGEEVIYMGRFPWFKWSLYENTGRTFRKKHIFAHPIPQWGSLFFSKNDVSFLAELNNEEPVQNYADLVDKFNADIHSSHIKQWKTKSIKPSLEITAKKEDANKKYLKRQNYTEMDGDDIFFWKLAIVHEPYPKEGVRGFRIVKDGVLNTQSLKYTHINQYYYYSYYRDNGPVLSRVETVNKLAKFVDIDMVLSSGKKLRLENINSIATD